MDVSSRSQNASGWSVKDSAWSCPLFSTKTVSGKTFFMYAMSRLRAERSASPYQYRTGHGERKNGFGHGVVVREIECPPDRIRAHAGQDYLPIQQIVPRELQRIREDIRHPHTERMKHDNDVGIPFSELMDRNLVRLHLFSGYLSREPGPAAVDPAAIVVVLLPVQIPQPFFLGVLHQYGHEPPEYERKEEKPEVPRHEGHPDAGEHERRVEWIADPRIDPRGPVFSRLLVHSRTPATSFFCRK